MLNAIAKHIELAPKGRLRRAVDALMLFTVAFALLVGGEAAYRIVKDQQEKAWLHRWLQA